MNQQELILESLKQYYVDVERDEWKLDTLFDLYETLAIAQVIIFCNTRQKTEWLREKMHDRGFPASLIHGEMDSKEHDLNMKEFRTGTTRVLVITGLPSCSIDVGQLPLTINYELPSDNESYVARIGRSGKFGRKGVIINFVTKEDHQRLKDIEQLHSIHIEELPMNISDLL
ncbi:unnamed protein product [Didymodactylos carnosus]|uniref:Helicase C-terminal domain-containing protein n=1 Tax=Didymodactylos carnosus TaxID=1234261 RepID=A0A814TQI3_9BILA|nr:unnamed protein product [Didymodactylos carnosus]CAF1164902.1 unnamed protein product [Didymodactylos carnosus]CAF3545724.1 unnamed protein product [Didymodactylos carnosus]CAF3928573.1 unnamed protein product [Didymodactylos carnosus]